MADRESDILIVLTRPGNAGRRKEDTCYHPLRDTSYTHRGKKLMETKLKRIAHVAKEKPQERFTSLYHLLNEELILQCHELMEKGKATGIDGISKQNYEENKMENIKDLVGRLKRHGYVPQPARRVYIPKDGGKERPLGIAAYEDKLVQNGLSRILNAIYEQDFMENSYGFRPRRNCHDALRRMNEVIERGKISYVVDADIKEFFDNVDHEQLIKFMEHRIADPNIIRLTKRLLKAGIMDEDVFVETNKGTPQGSVVSPILGNIYLHYVLDLWFEKIVKKKSDGQAEIVRYADDFICCFQYKKDAETFYRKLKERLRKFGLEVAEDKTKIIKFGRYAEEDCKERGCKPDTFDFLGFTHYCSKDRLGKTYRVKRRTSKKKFRKKVKDFKMWLKSVKDKSNIHIIFEKSKQKLSGHYRYYGITDNAKAVWRYHGTIVKTLYKWLNRRSQRKSFGWENFNKYLKLNPLPKPKIYVSIYSKSV